MKLLDLNEIKPVSGGVLLNPAQWSTVFGLSVKAITDHFVARLIRNSPNGFIAQFPEVAYSLSAFTGLTLGYATFNHLAVDDSIEQEECKID